MNWFWAAIAALVLIAAWPMIAEAMRRPMNSAARKLAPGQFATLSKGVTHYRWRGPEEGPLVVCVHGLTTASLVWDSIAQHLAEQGYRVLTYDHFGRGFSDRPKALQDAEFFLRHLNELLDHEGVDQKFTLIGYSMGGAVSTCYADTYPERLNHLVLLAAAGVMRPSGGLISAVLGVPLLGDWLMKMRYPSILRKGILAERSLPSSVPGLNDAQLAELDYRGFLPSVRASVQGLMTYPFEEAHHHIAETGLPVLAIWGGEDDVVPVSSNDILAQWNPGARQEIVASAGHGLPYTHTADVMAHLGPWLETR